MQETPNGQRKRVTIGRFPDLGIAAARAEASKLRAQVWTGADPLAQRAAAAELERVGRRWVLRFAGAEIKLPRRATFDHAEAELRRRGFAC